MKGVLNVTDSQTHCQMSYMRRLMRLQGGRHDEPPERALLTRNGQFTVANGKELGDILPNRQLQDSSKDYPTC